MSATDPHHVTHQALHRTIEAVWRVESARVIAGFARLTRDVGLAEDLAQEALLAALEQRPQSGVPDNPAGWLTAPAKPRAIDLFRLSLANCYSAFDSLGFPSRYHSSMCNLPFFSSI